MADLAAKHKVCNLYPTDLFYHQILLCIPGGLDCSVSFVSRVLGKACIQGRKSEWSPIPCPPLVEGENHVQMYTVCPHTVTCKLTLALIGVPSLGCCPCL